MPLSAYGRPETTVYLGEAQVTRLKATTHVKQASRKGSACKLAPRFEYRKDSWSLISFF